jgi:hypothetical protein
MRGGISRGKWERRPGKPPVRPVEMAGLPGRNTLEIILMLGFGLPEAACQNHFGQDLAGPQAGSIDVGDGRCHIPPRRRI